MSKDTVIINGIEYVPKVITPEPVKVGRWKPEEDKRYWYLTSEGLPTGAYWHENHLWHEKRYTSGNVYQTEALATHASDKHLLLVELQDFADRVNAEQAREYPMIGYEVAHYKDKFIASISSSICFMTIKFNRPQGAQSAIEYFGDRLNLLR